VNLTLTNVTKTYQKGAVEVTALTDLSLDVAAGEFVMLVGVSGSGKSTLLNLMGGLAKPSSGQVRADDLTLNELDSDGLAAYRRKSVGFVFQSFHLVPTLTVTENVLLPLVPLRDPADEKRRRAEALVEQVGLADRAHHLPSELSGGEQQRVAIARALINDPDLLLADEPTSDLDTKTGRQIVDLLKQFHAAGTTVVLSTHDERLTPAATRVVRLEDGRITSQ